MSHLPTSAQPFVCTPLDESRPLAYTLWKTDFLSQASTRDLAGFYIEPNHVPRGNRLEALKVSKTYLELDEIDNWEFYVVDISLSEYDRNLRLAEIKAHTAAIQVKAINVEAGKKLAAQCSAAHTFLVSAISVNLRRLYQTTVCPYSLFELLKFTEESCIDTLAVELTDLVKRYRVSMTPPSFNLLDASAISSIDYDTHIWNYHTLCAMSDTFINDKELWEVVTNYVSTARAAGTPVVVDGVWVSLRRILTNRLQRASALGDHGSAATIQSRSQFAAVTHAVAAPAPPSTAISQPDGSYHVLNAFTIPAYAHHDCVKIPGKSCFYCGVANHTLPVCPTLKTDYVRNTMLIKGNGIFALHADLRYCANDAGDPPLPQSVTYGPANFPALREHWIVDSGASTSCTPNRDYFSRYIPCALSLTVGNGARLPVVGYGAISMLVDMSSRDQVDDIRPCTLRLNFGLHCPELQFNLFSVRQASDDDITVRFPARDVCEITTSFGDVLNAPNTMGLYSFPSQPKVVPTDPHHGESLHISDLTRFRAMMASFETALRTFSTKY
ncbi:hypothetical protein DYB26_008482, partial [Aphanomyces astaci]